LRKERSDFFVAVRPYTHRYPKCWRCKEELVWRVVDEWYIGMDYQDPTDEGKRTLREQLQDVTRQVEKWVPDFGFAREMDWLVNMHDWLISKKRYWGLALPIWECECGHFEVIGSREELKNKAISGWPQFEGRTPHRPWIDQIKIKCPTCGKMVSRVPDVGNPWLDAGIVPYSTLKYFEDRDYWRQWFPADLITECFPGQFRNWFYSLLAMSAVLERKAPFKALVGHALVRDEKGEEMHKSKGNAIWFDEGVEKMGADVMRWLFCRQNPAVNINFGYHFADEVRRRFFLILWNSYKFFVTYANLDKWEPSSSSRVTPTFLDKWLLSRLASLQETVTASLKDYDIFKATLAIEDFVINDLSTWYIRLSRSRVGPTADGGERALAFYQTSYQVLTTLVRLMAPFVPYITEVMWQNLREDDDEESIHLSPWPVTGSRDGSLERTMALVRQVVEQGRAARARAGINLRQPLAKALVSLDKSAEDGSLLEILAQELNVKKVVLQPLPEDSLVELDFEITEELRLEGLARDLVREIQNRRKKIGCRFDQEVKVTYEKSMEAVIARFGEDIKKKVLAKELLPGDKLEVIP